MQERNAVRRMVRMGSSSRKSYRLTMPNFFTVCAGAPSSQCGRTCKSVSHTPFSKISCIFAAKMSSALLMVSPLSAKSPAENFSVSATYIIP